jgi:putative ABC transport system permease protein
VSSIRARRQAGSSVRCHPSPLEIGIRAALGAGPRGIVLGVLSKVTRQIAVGIVVGSVIAWQLDRAMNGGFTGGRGAYLLAVVAAMMMVVGLLAAAGPARRALRIQPTEALKGE